MPAMQQAHLRQLRLACCGGSGYSSTDQCVTPAANKQHTQSHNLEDAPTLPVCQYSLWNAVVPRFFWHMQQAVAVAFDFHVGRCHHHQQQVSGVAWSGWLDGCAWVTLLSCKHVCRWCPASMLLWQVPWLAGGGWQLTQAVQLLELHILQALRGWLLHDAACCDDDGVVCLAETGRGC